MLFDIQPIFKTTLVIFGATGDLAKKKLYPALFQLALNDLIGDNVDFVGVGRTVLNDDQYRKLVQESIGKTDLHHRVFRFLDRFKYIVGDVITVPEKIKASVANDRQLFFYLALKPELYEATIRGLYSNMLLENGGFKSKFLIEKPFGFSYSSAFELARILHDIVSEDQIYRIDHYLAKDLIQNIFVLRFCNDFVDGILTKDFVSNIQLTLSEDIGVEGRGDYFDQTGIVRDMFQNHLLQVLALSLMERPASLNPKMFSYEKLKTLSLIRVYKENFSESMLVRAQYESGFIRGLRVISYREEPRVELNSQTETFFVGAFECCSPRWNGVPIFVRVGKRLPKRLGLISFIFKKPIGLSKEFQFLSELYNQPALRIEFQPSETISIQMYLKSPGFEIREQPAFLSLDVPKYFQPLFKDAYSRVLYDAIRGDRFLFANHDEIMQSWRVVDPILDLFAKGVVPLRFYPAGCWGPIEANNVPQNFGCKWEDL
ncbi:MAG: glucose-6-phosphate dehydrogenase [Deltaproteobacteria bacterium]|nr:glucose-6-phosphate dehydrogenase [Deltaproteobacteria bacterium]